MKKLREILKMAGAIILTPFILFLFLFVLLSQHYDSPFSTKNGKMNIFSFFLSMIFSMIATIGVFLDIIMIKPLKLLAKILRLEKK